VKRRIPAAAVFLALAAVVAVPEPPRPERAPDVWEQDLADIDIAALSPGEWAEYEMTGPDWPAAGNRRPVRRLACVDADAELAWIEITVRNGGPGLDGGVLALGVRKKDRHVEKAFWSRGGAEAAPVPVREGRAGGAALPGGSVPNVTGTGTVSKEKIKAGSSTLDCEKVELETLVTVNCCESKCRTTTWVSEKVPFRVWAEDPPRVEGIPAEIQWVARPTVRGGLVKRSVFRDNATTTAVLVRWGTDAKETLKRPDAK